MENAVIRNTAENKMSLKNLYLNILFSSNSSILAHAKHKKQQPIQIKRSAPEWSTGVCALFFASFSLVCLLIVFLFALARQFSFNRSLNKLTFCSAPHACQIQFYSFSLSFFLNFDSPFIGIQFRAGEMNEKNFFFDHELVIVVAVFGGAKSPNFIRQLCIQFS